MSSGEPQEHPSDQTSLLDRPFREKRRRVDSAGHLVGGQQVLKIMYEAMIYLIGKAEYLGKIGSK
jgi:hypothetical protein